MFQLRVLYHSSLLKEVKVGIEGRNLETETDVETMEVSCLLVFLLTLYGLFNLLLEALRTTSLEVAMPTMGWALLYQASIKINAPCPCPQASLVVAISSIEVSYSKMTPALSNWHKTNQLTRQVLCHGSVPIVLISDSLMLYVNKPDVFDLDLPGISLAFSFFFLNILPGTFSSIRSSIKKGEKQQTKPKK